MIKISDCWQTPQWLFDDLNQEFDFDIDLCATKENSKCGVSFCSDYLNDVMSVEGQANANLYELFKVGGIKSAFMNPPYSNPKPFIEKAWEDSKHCKIVCLVKCDPSTRWWATFWVYNQIRTRDVGCTTGFDGTAYDFISEQYLYNGPKPGCEVRFFPKRIKFIPPEGLNGKTGPTFPCALVIMDRRDEKC